MVIDIEHKYYFIIFFSTLLGYVVCSKVIYRRMCSSNSANTTRVRGELVDVTSPTTRRRINSSFVNAPISP
jgi:hypothetical protein